MSSMRYRNNQTLSRQIQHTRIEDEKEIEAHYVFGEQLGKGSFGTVTEATRTSDGTRWAVKVINKEKAGSAGVKLLEREVAIMKKVDHPNIIHLEEVFETTDKMFLVMELCAHGGLEESLGKKCSFSEKESLCIVRQLMDAVAYMHENDIIHRDLKLDNILLAEPSGDLIYNIKLTDFGLSYTRGGSGSDYMMNQMVGTPIYMAPEVITNYGYSQQCDIWSIGVIMYKLISGDSPFMASNEEELFELIKQGDLRFSSGVWSSISSAAKRLIEGMMKVDPAHRLTSKEVLFHPWIKGEQDTNGTVTTNVLEMMKQYNLEQKKLAEKEKNEVNNNLEKCNDDVAVETEDQFDESGTQTEVRKTLSIPGNNKVDGKKSPRLADRRSVCKTVSLPSYMQPTKSSKAPKCPNTKATRKR